VEFEGKTFPTSEHAYQHGKIKVQFKDKTDESVRDWIMAAPKPHLVALVCHNLLSWDIVEGWSKKRFNRMHRVLQAKFQDEVLKRKLLATGNAILIENSKTDSIWGCGKKGNGKNMLGKLLMKVRKELRES